MNKNWKNLLTSILVLISSTAFAGIEVGNGGNVVVCKKSDGSVLSAEVLDLYEARALKGIIYQESTEPYLSQSLKLAMDVTVALGQPPAADGSFINDMKKDIAHFIFLPPGVGLKPIPDSDEFIFPKNCSVQQAVNYKDFDHIYVDSDIWNMLSETQKAALVLHESVYRYLRDSGSKAQRMEFNSVRTRKIVSYLISGQKLESVVELKDLDKSQPLHLCYTEEALKAERPSTTFYAYTDIHGKLNFQFLDLADYRIFTRSWVIGAGDEESISAASNLNSVIDRNFRINVQWWLKNPSKNRLWIKDANGKNYEESFICRPT